MTDVENENFPECTSQKTYDDQYRQTGHTCPVCCSRKNGRDRSFMISVAVFFICASIKKNRCLHADLASSNLGRFREPIPIGRNSTAGSANIREKRCSFQPNRKRRAQKQQKTKSFMIRYDTYQSWTKKTVKENAKKQRKERK